MNSDREDIIYFQFKHKDHFLIKKDKNNKKNVSYKKYKLDEAGYIQKLNGHNGETTFEIKFSDEECYGVTLDEFYFLVKSYFIG